MSLFVDKYRPNSMEKLEIHEEINEQLSTLVQSGDLPHLLFCGPNGAGKKTRISVTLKEIFGNAADKLKVEQKTWDFQLPSRKIKVDVTMVSSIYHIEITPADAGIRDSLVVQRVIKEIASSIPLDSTTNQKTFKVVVLNEVDRLSKNAQHALRRTMEKYSSTCRIILNCTHSSKIIEPLRSRCLLFRVPAPTDDQIKVVLQKIAKKESFQLPDDMCDKIITISNNNLRKAILSLEATKVQQYPFTANQQPQIPNWNLYIQHIAQNILQEQTPACLVKIRGKFYELLSHCIPATDILKELVIELFKLLDSQLKFEVVKWAAFYEHRLHISSKEIYHLEGFVAKFMSIYKEFLMTLGDF